jgi:ubiquitin carboxyl-terminal hydrolase 4/11
MQQQTTATKRAREPSISSDQEDRARTPVDVCLPDSDDAELDQILQSWTDGPTTDTEVIPDLSPNEQLEYIVNLKESPLEEGQTWYLVANRWYTQWEHYCKRVASQSPSTRDLGLKLAPGKIDNRSILDGNHLKPNLSPNTDFHLIPEKAWRALVQW